MGVWEEQYGDLGTLFVWKHLELSKDMKGKALVPSFLGTDWKLVKALRHTGLNDPTINAFAFGAIPNPAYIC